MLTFSVGAILGKPQGATERFDFCETASWDGPGEPSLAGPISGSVQFLKLPHEINVQISRVHTVVCETCSRCLKPIQCSLDIALAEREFFIDPAQRDLEEGEEVKYVNLSTKEIDLRDMLREEILLHSPAVAVCSEGCKGLCGQCGANLNETPCGCPRRPSAPKISFFKKSH